MFASSMVSVRKGAITQGALSDIWAQQPNALE
jgi:hypothetical protein